MRLCPAVLFLMMMAIAGLCAQSKGPLIEFETTKVERGKVIQGETIKQVFGFANKGIGTLEILDVEHS